MRTEIEKRFPTTSHTPVYTTLDLLEEIGELVPIREERRRDTTHPQLTHEERGKVGDLEEEIVEEKISGLAALAPRR